MHDIGSFMDEADGKNNHSHHKKKENDSSLCVNDTLDNCLTFCDATVKIRELRCGFKFRTMPCF